MNEFGNLDYEEFLKMYTANLKKEALRPGTSAGMPQTAGGRRPTTSDIARVCISTRILASYVLCTCNIQRAKCLNVMFRSNYFWPVYLNVNN